MAIDEIHHAASRRAFLAGAAAFAGFSAFGRSASARQSATPGATATIDTEFGTVEIPVDPQRVAVMENTGDLEIALALDLPIVAVGVWGTVFMKDGQWLMPWIPVNPEGIEPFDTSESDLELLLAIEPDLIVSRTYYLDPAYGYGYDGLSQVAPIIPVGSGLVPWDVELQQVADWLQRADRLAPAMEEYSALLADVQERHADTISDSKVAILRPNSPVELYINADPNNLFVDGLQRLGGQLSAVMDEGDQMLSVERLDALADADAILIWAFDEDLHYMDEVEVWQGLHAVAAGKTRTVGAELLGGSVYSALEVLRSYDALFTLLEG